MAPTSPTRTADEPLHRRLGLTDGELAAIEVKLGRAPNDLELAMFSVMWSEHCSYKSSKPLLRTLPTAGAGVVAGPGENAGVISIGFCCSSSIARSVARKCWMWEPERGFLASRWRLPCPKLSLL